MMECRAEQRDAMASRGFEKASRLLADGKISDALAIFEGIASVEVATNRTLEAQRRLAEVKTIKTELGDVRIRCNLMCTYITSSVSI